VKFDKVAAQDYDTDINKEFVISKNSAILKCILPAYLSDYLEIISWRIDDDELSYDDKNYGTFIKLQHTKPIPFKFPALYPDFNPLNLTHISNEYLVVIQHYDTDVNKGYSIRGNAAILRCEFPSFVGDYLNVIAWHTDEEEIFKANDSNYGTLIIGSSSSSIVPLPFIS
jgi:hypothetical protein